MKSHRHRPWRYVSAGRLGRIGLLLAVSVLVSCARATPTAAPLVRGQTPEPTRTAAVYTPTPEPTATPVGPVQPVGSGLVRYVNSAAGFSFQYPATWSLIETPATDAQPAAVWLRWELFRLLLEYKFADNGPPLQLHGSARNWRQAGHVFALDQNIDREVLRVEGKVKRTIYRVSQEPVHAGDLVLGITLRSAAVDECMGVFDLDCDYAAVDIPETLQEEADRIVSSLELVPASEASLSADDGYLRYVRADYGFAFRYPAGWVLSEGRDFVAFTQGTVRLVVGYGGPGHESNVCCTLGPDLETTQEAGSIEFLGQPLGKAVLTNGAAVRAVVYNAAEPVTASGRTFLAYLQDYAADSGSASIPPRLQLEADQILASLVLLEPAFPLPGPAPMPTEEPPAPTPEIVAPSDALVRGGDTGGNVRSGPGRLYEVVGFLGPGESVRVVGKFRDWWQIEYGEEPGWISAQVVLAEQVDGVPDARPPETPGAPPPEAGPIAVVGASKLNLRAGPGAEYLRLGTLDPGARVPLLGRYLDWWKVSFEGGVGWISGEFVTPFNAESVPVVDAPAVAISPNPEVIPPPAGPSEIQETRWIDLDLSEQRVTVYEGGKPIYQTLVSTGLPGTPTPPGQFRIWIKLRYDDMSGPGYYLEDVPYVMYFYQGYGFHGVWWHGNFGHPMSHGCVNMPNGADEWLFNWADVGTLVNIHE